MIAQAAEHQPPAIVLGRKAQAFVDYYFGVKTHADGSFDRWYRIPCNGRCHIIKVKGSSTTIVGSVVLAAPRTTHS